MLLSSAVAVVCCVVVQAGLFVENGPFRVRELYDLSINPHSWNKEANLLYIDQVCFVFCCVDRVFVVC